LAFTSFATDLVAGADTDEDLDVFLFDRSSGAVSLVSHSAGSPTTAGNSASALPSMSADGRFIAFSSVATDVVAGQVDTNAGNTSGGADVFIYRRSSTTSTLLSHVPNDPLTTANGWSTNDATFGNARDISADGSTVTLLSTATDLSPGQVDVNGNHDVFVWTGDTASPSVTVRPAPGQATRTGGLPVTFTVTFSEPVTGFTASDVVVGGTAGASGVTVTGGPTAYTVTIARVARAGTVTVAVPAGRATDAADNPNTASNTAGNGVTFSFACQSACR
jgi:hypothetical protein